MLPLWTLYSFGIHRRMVRFLAEGNQLGGGKRRCPHPYIPLVGQGSEFSSGDGPPLLRPLKCPHGDREEGGTMPEYDESQIKMALTAAKDLSVARDARRPYSTLPQADIRERSEIVANRRRVENLLASSFIKAGF